MSASTRAQNNTFKRKGFKGLNPTGTIPDVLLTFLELGDVQGGGFWGCQRLWRAVTYFTNEAASGSTSANVSRNTMAFFLLQFCITSLAK